MKYYIKEVVTENKVQKTAGVKARDDVNAIVERKGWKPIVVENNKDEQEKRKTANFLKKLDYHRVVRNHWLDAMSVLQSGDELLIQFPSLSHSLLLFQAIKKVQNRGVHICLLIHDLELFRTVMRTDQKNSFKKNLRISLEEKTILKAVDCVIVHNSKMKNIILQFGIKEEKIVELGIFDYLIPAADDERMKKSSDEMFACSAPVVIAGNLRKHKAAYAYKLAEKPEFNLYGVDYEHEQDNVHYFGAFPPDDLPFVMKGSYGLVWDGELTETCSGVFGEYLRMNNPHKTSLYLAAGLPVVIWKQAALADFVINNKCGILIESINDLEEEIQKVTEADYAQMKENALRVSKQMREGYYTCTALEEFSRNHG